MQVLILTSIVFGALAVAFVVLSVRAFRGRRWIGTAGRSTVGALFAALSALAATLSVSTHGYRALTSEEVALTVTTVPTGPHAFQAYVEFPDGRDTTLAVRGDQVLVDARILKWKYVANLLGLRTQYELDRLTGRYVDIEDERTLERTVHALGADKPIDLHDLVQRYSLLRFLVDAEYGSASYVDVREPARFEVRVSTTGLLIREIPLR
ncbi:MAG TPA: hypothetical protein VFQ22_02805 [Longimicrobiales bacterium]|nr:hypothetical protein [Longimicrobiales bacterium]